MASLKELQDNWFKENQPLGKKLGYPDCCIQAFCDQPPELLEQQGATDDDRTRFYAACINGKFTGFIPCIAHAKEIQAGKITLASLVNNRSLEFPPFPKFANNSF